MNLGNVFQLILWMLIFGSAGCGTSSPPQPESRARSHVDLNSADSIDQGDEGDDKSRDNDEEEDEDENEDDEETLKEGEETSSKDDEEEADDDKGEAGDLVITANETQHDDAKIAVRSEGGTWEEFAWPKSGTPITVKGVCRSNKPLEVRATSEQGEAVSLPHADFGVLSQADATASLGYEPTHCTGSKCWDDNTITMECTEGDLKLKGI